jgi:cytochrome c5
MTNTRHLVYFVFLAMLGATPALASPLQGTVKTEEIGKRVYGEVCAACHRTGAAGAPKDIRALARPREVLLRHTFEGFQAMPARGGDPNLTADELIGAVEYMLSDRFGTEEVKAALPVAPKNVAGNAEFVLVAIDLNYLTNQVRNEYYVDFSSIRRDPHPDTPGEIKLMKMLVKHFDPESIATIKGKPVLSNVFIDQYNCSTGEERGADGEAYSTQLPQPSTLLATYVRPTPQNHGLWGQWVNRQPRYPTVLVNPNSSRLLDIACGRLQRADFR